MRRISSSRPMIGSSLPCSARSVRSIVYFSSAWRVSSAFGSLTCWPPRSRRSTSRSHPHGAGLFHDRCSGDLSSIAASTNSSLEMYWSSRSCASLSVRLKSFVSRCRYELAAGTLDFRQAIDASPSCERSRLTLTPDLVSRPRTVPPCWSSSATITCAGSMN